MKFKKFTIVAGALLPAIEFETDDDFAQDVNLADVDSVRFIMASKETGANEVDAAAEVVSPASAGKLKYQWQAGDTDTVGEYRAQFRCVADSAVFYIPSDDYITVSIIAAVPRATP